MKRSKFAKRISTSILSVAMLLSALPAVTAQETESSLPKAGLIETGTVSDQPLASGTAGSTYFRIPALITLQDGSIVAAADARYSTTGDGGGLDTIVSISSDNGETWQTSMPLYFPDSNGYAGTSATTIIDPVLIQGSDGTIYLMADVNPTGVTTMGGYTAPNAGTGYIEIDDVQRLVLTSSYDNVNTAPTAEDTSTYEYYVGDLADNGYAPVISRADKTETTYAVDECFNLYTVADGVYTALTQQQVNNSATTIQQNVYYAASALHVYNTGYMWLATSTDNGASWSYSVLNPQIKREGETALLVSPGRGLLCTDNTVVIPFYTHDTSTSAEQSSFIFSKDNGETWTRSPDIPNTNGWSSENEMVELSNGTLRMFVRNGQGKIAYADAVWDETSQNYVWSNESGITATDVTVTSTCNVSAIKYSKQIDGKDAVLVACPGSGSERTNGRIFTFLVDEDNSMSLAYTFEVNNDYYAYSCLTELTDGTVALLWENAGAEITYSTYDIADIALGAVIDNTRNFNLPLYGETALTSEGAVNADFISSVNATGLVSAELSSTTDYAVQLGSDASYNGDLSFIGNALFTFTGSTSEGWTCSAQTDSGTQVYLSLEAAKVPTATAAYPITFTSDSSGLFEIYRAIDTNYTGYLYFQQSSTTLYFDRNSSSSAPATKFMLFRRASEDEESSSEINGFVQITSAGDITSGEQYLIAAVYDSTYYVLYPSDGGSYYSYVGKVTNQTKTTSTVVYKGLKEGSAEVTDSDTGIKYVFNVTADNLVEITLEVGETVSLEIEQTDDCSNIANTDVATFNIANENIYTTYTGAQGNLGSDANYTGDLTPMSKALFTFADNGDGTYTVFNKNSAGETVYFSVAGTAPAEGESPAGYPFSTTADSVKFIDNGSGLFDIYTSTNYTGYLYFWRNGYNYFDRQTTTADATKFMLYRPVEENETSNTGIKGYARLTSASEITSGGKYLIVALYGSDYYALYPSTSTSDKYSHVIKVNSSASVVSDTITEQKFMLTVTGVAEGATDELIDGIIYRVTVTPATSGVKLGDVNSDKKVNSQDASLVLQVYAKILQADAEGYNPDAADVNGDGKADALDATLILQFYAKIIGSFPA